MNAKPKHKNTDRSLSEVFSLSHRYTRSINLERDVGNVALLKDYVVTERTAHTLDRIVSGVFDGSVRSWILTGVYGTGKSAFGQFFLSLFAPSNPVRRTAESILVKSKANSLRSEHKRAWKELRGMWFAVCTGQREPVGASLLRCLQNALRTYKPEQARKRQALLRQVSQFIDEYAVGRQVAGAQILKLIREVAEISDSGLFIVIDELGKPLEHAVQNRDENDVYLLQQISELPQKDLKPVYFVGLLHHAFSEYAQRLGSVERNEWLKVQGRFEEIPFTESTAQMVQLIGRVIMRAGEPRIEERLNILSARWYKKLSDRFSTKLTSADVLSKSLPLHPIAAAVLPELFVRYAQNDRSLFSFLTSNEPHSLKRFLEETSLHKAEVPLFKLALVYDYFIETSLSNLILKPNFQRWIELKNLIDEHESTDRDLLALLKTIGILNLANTTGFARASRDLVVLALCDSPNDKQGILKWNRLIDESIARGLIAHRRQVGELRLWEGSDFDFDEAIASGREKLRVPLRDLLEKSHAPRAIVAQRHSYQSGAVRYFESRYFDDSNQFDGVACHYPGSAGLVGYWVSDVPLSNVPAETSDGKPLLMIQARRVESLRSDAREHAALIYVLENSDELKSDSVARREVRHRLILAKYILDESFTRATYQNDKLEVWVEGSIKCLESKRELNTELSRLCDEVYRDRITLWNELINRQELTSQGAKARRQVIEAILSSGDKEDLGLAGNGPEVSVYQSVLKRTGIHRKTDETIYEFGRPTMPSFQKVWDRIEQYCLDATDQPKRLDSLFETMQRQPFGLKAGLIPVLFAAVIIAHSDDVGIYKDDRFISQLGSEHFELLVKDPARFSVKHYHVAGVRAEVFRQVESIISETANLPVDIRNRTVLGVVTQLLRFAKRLPSFSKTTERLSKRAQEVRRILLGAPEPDELLFRLLPIACDLAPFDSTSELPGGEIPRVFRDQLASTLKEIRESYEQLLSDCRALLYQAFGVKQDVERLREDLRVRASYLQGRSIEPVLSRFILGATEPSKTDSEWLQALLMIIADKPVDSWTDLDTDGFEVKLTDIARRFTHLEAISKNNTKLWNGSAEARRLSVLRTDGRELHDIAWIEENEKAIIEKAADNILGTMVQDKAQQKALLTVLAEKILSADLSQVFRAESETEEVENETRVRSFRRKG
ncbi:MAG: hypothetical protein ACKVQW_15510 [Pyrinomonadaceae bacterium]